MMIVSFKDSICLGAEHFMLLCHQLSMVSEQDSPSTEIRTIMLLNHIQQHAGVAFYELPQSDSGLEDFTHLVYPHSTTSIYI